MATSTKRTRFSRRLPDHVTDELVNALTIKRTYEFNTLFEAVYEQLKLRNAVSGGEEMLRLRAYEKLQNLVSRGLVEKIGKTYRGLEGVQNARTPVMPPQIGVPGMAVAASVVAPVITPKVVIAPIPAPKLIPISTNSKVTTTVTKAAPSKVTSISKVTSSKVVTKVIAKPRPKVAAR